MKHEHPESKQAKRQYCQEHIESWKRRGLGQTEYCRLNSLRIKNFWYWKKRYSKETAQQLLFICHRYKLTEMAAKVKVRSGKGLRGAGLTFRSSPAILLSCFDLGPNPSSVNGLSSEPAGEKDVLSLLRPVSDCCLSHPGNDSPACPAGRI